MIKSMTGYGAAKGEYQGIAISVELKSVNNRYLDTSVRIPRSYIFAEEHLKARVLGHISRGKVDVFITLDTSAAEDTVIKVNVPLAEGYFRAVTELSERFGIEAGLDGLLLSKLPDVLTAEKKETDRDGILETLSEILENALGEFDLMRGREGEKLREDVDARLLEIERLTTLIEERSPATVAEYRAKLLERMQEILESTQIDSERILQEAAIFADRVSTNEETVRLRSHISQLRDMLTSASPVGRKLDFLIQELNREANTIGSKGNDIGISHYVVDMKAEIEKIREQAQNIE